MTETGCGDAQFVALQGSRNGESLLADNMQDGVRIARDNPDRGVVVRIAGEGRPWNPGAITGGRVWGDIPDNSVQPGAGNGEPVTAEVLAQRQAEEAIRRETERRADEIVRKMAENKPDLPDGKTEQAVREIAGQERGRPCDDGADRWSGVVCRKIITPFLARGFFPDVLCLSSGCAGRSGAVTGVVSLAARG